MSPRTVRAAKIGLGALLLALVAAVAVTLKRHPAGPRATSTAPDPQPSASANTRMGGFVHRQFKGEQEVLVIRARSSEGSETTAFHLQGVDIEFYYSVHGERKKGTVTADECEYTPALQKAIFKGNVIVRTAEGHELKSPSLIQRGDKNLARTEDQVEFVYKAISGTATGMTYDGETGRLELLADVVMHVRDPDQPEAQITAARAVSDRETGTMEFKGGVEVIQGADRLKSQKLEMGFAPDTQVISRVQAIDDVQLWTGAGTEVPGITGATAGRGPRYLTARKLDMSFRPDGSLQEAIAGQDADLTLLPAPGEPQEKRHLKSRFLVFVFDAAGRVEELRGQKDSVFSAEPLKGSKEQPRKILCRNFQAKMDAKGEPKVIEFDKDVEFTQGARHATAGKAYFEGGGVSTLFLTGEPVLVDSAQNTELRAQSIDIGTTTGDLAAKTGVRHVLRRKSPKGGLLGGGGEPVLVTSRFFEYAASTRTAHYRDDALLRSGRDEVRAALIKLTEAADGRRRLEGEGSVISRMHPSSKAAGPKKPAAVEGRAKQMVYEEALGRIVYTGDVVIRQGDITTRSPAATMSLTSDGTGIEALQAGEPVEVQQGLRRATGQRGTYNPAAETFLLVGDKVVLTDPKQLIEGRSLTFHVGDERILVDGREEVRTQMIIKKQESR